MLVLLSLAAGGFVHQTRGQAEAPASERRRGRFLRTEIVRTETADSFNCILAPTNEPFPVLRFRGQENITHDEVAVYEVLVPEEPEAEESDFTGVTYRVLPDEEMRGETTTRQVTRDTGPFANATFEIGGITLTTDDKGLFVDRQQAFLKPFDDLGINTWDVTVHHEKLGTVPLTLSRYLTRRWSDENPDDRIRMSHTDILAATGLTYEPLSPTDHSGLTVTVVTPETVRPGQVIAIKLTAVNSGRKPVSCLLARLFSRHEWLSGTNVYIGNLAPGQTQSFERRLTVPQTVVPGQAIYASLGFWDILGPIKGAARRIKIMPEAMGPAAER